MDSKDASNQGVEGDPEVQEVDDGELGFGQDGQDYETAQNQ